MVGMGRDGDELRHSTGEAPQSGSDVRPRHRKGSDPSGTSRRPIPGSAGRAHEVDAAARRAPLRVHSGLDRLSEVRDDPGTISRLLDRPDTRVLVWVDGQFPVLGGATGPTALATRAAAPGDDGGQAVLLGRDPSERAWLALLLGPTGQPLAADVPDAPRSDPTLTERTQPTDPPGARPAVPPPAEVTSRVSQGLPEGVTWRGLRDFGPGLPELELEVAMTAQALARWHASHPRCPRCGAVTRVVHCGWVRRCPVDDSEHHPRSDPAVIMAVTDPRDRLLLARSPRWPPLRMSVLAGFVEPGERLEAAVAREVREEVGLEVLEVHYSDSQPWPFPASIMLAFTARARTSELRIDPREIAEARWVTRSELVAQVASGAMIVPGPLSVARRLVEGWLGHPLHPPVESTFGRG